MYLVANGLHSNLTRSLSIEQLARLFEVNTFQVGGTRIQKRSTLFQLSLHKDQNMSSYPSSFEFWDAFLS